MNRLPLTQGLFTVVDDGDYAKLSDHKWCVAKSKEYWYAVRSVRVGDKKVRIYLHREVMGNPKGLFIDHINHDTLDNRKENLRLATPKQNCQNRRAGPRKVGTLKGVQFTKNRKNPWKAMFWNGIKMIGLGYFKTERLAHEAYKEKALQRHKEFFHE